MNTDSLVNDSIATTAVDCFPEITPGKLVKIGETIGFNSSQRGQLILRRGFAGEFAVVMCVELVPFQDWTWIPTELGMYQAEWKCQGATLKRPIAVVTKEWAVCQITVGAFTAEDFADIIHQAGISADYYIAPNMNCKSKDYSFRDPRWLRYEREFGDEIYPHVMPNDIGVLNTELAHEDANWDSLSYEGIIERLSFLQEWWQDQGYQPLNRIASYTPCNSFVRACEDLGIRIIHSMVPEQNWSDGEWSINHWGMPNCPFWIAADDFRKAGVKSETGVLAMSMNHYQVLLPHLTMWGDFVLSPSHFTRWLRAADSGVTSTRFRQFLKETMVSWTSLSDDPFFFVAGFEFGRTFGTSNMTEYNRCGLEALLELSKTNNVVFATGDDVRSYYDRHLNHIPETVFRQRDHWVGVTVNGKPGQVGDSIVIECKDYKALIREGEYLPFFYYDYREKWTFGTCDMNAPRDFSTQLRQELKVTRKSETMLLLHAEKPISRSVPVGIWDAIPDNSAFKVTRLPELDDQRVVCSIEIHAGWSGEQSLRISPSRAPISRQDDIWKMQTFGEPNERHTYLYLDAPLTQNFRAKVILKKKSRVDTAIGTMGILPAGTLELEFGLLQGWYRFWGCEVSDIKPEANVKEGLERSGFVLDSDWKIRLVKHQDELNLAAVNHIDKNETVLYQIHCGALLPLGTRSRAKAFDQVAIPHPTLQAYEKSDGAIAFAPGCSFWYHPRCLSFRVEGFPKSISGCWHILLNSFDPLKLNARYKVFVGNKELPIWKVTDNSLINEAFYKITLTENDLDSNRSLNIRLQSDQKALLHWWSEKGYIAALHALWITSDAVA